MLGIMCSILCATGILCETPHKVTWEHMQDEEDFSRSKIVVKMKGIKVEDYSGEPDGTEERVEAPRLSRYPSHSLLQTAQMT